MSRFQFVADHRDTFEVKLLCEIVEVSRSSSHAWLTAAPVRAERAAADHRQPNDAPSSAMTGRVNHKRIARVTREHGIAALRLRRKIRTTVSEVVPDLLEWDLTAPNVK